MEPALDRLRGAIELFGKLSGNTAIEPLAGKTEADGLDGTKRFFLRRKPALPERAIIRCPIQKVGELVSMVEADIAAQQVPEQMQRSLRDPVHFVQGVEFETIDPTYYSPIPKHLKTRNRDVLRCRIP